MTDIIKHSAYQFSENFESLVTQIKSIGEALQQDARVVINRNITTKAWLTGYYIVEYEQHGNDKAKYGDNLLQNISKRLGGKSYSATNLRSYRLFYSLYPELRPVIANYLFERLGKDKVKSASIPFLSSQIQQSLIAELKDEGKQQSVTAKSAKMQDSLMVTGISSDGFAMSLSDGSVKTVPQALFDRLSFTHIVQLLHVEDSMQRAFYAIEAMRGPWSVRELQRQIDTNYYARSGWSKKPELLSKKINGTAERPTTRAGC